jgi:ubiquinol-cytochrome c reductase iron-sulfur subunit
MSPMVRAALAFVVATLAAVGFAVAYVAGLGNAVLGAALTLALAAIGYGLVVWSTGGMATAVAVEQRADLAAPPSSNAAAAAFEEGERVIRRRGLLGGLLALAAGTLGLAALFPVRSLGPHPQAFLRTTSWRTGRRVVRDDGRPVRIDDLEVGGAVTVFPEGHLDDPDAQVLLVRVEEGLLVPAAGREDWAPSGYLAYSKVCTHAGCPVGLYQRESHRLLCPCHQSAFEVLEGARPVFGPAARPLPQLPLDIDADGFLVARSDFLEPVGPGFWARPRT